MTILQRIRRGPADPRLRRALRGARLVLSLAGLAFLVMLVQAQVDLGRLRGAVPWLAASFLLSQTGLALFAARLRRVLGVLGLALPFGTALRIHLQSMFYYVFVPAGLGYELSKLGKLAARFPAARVREIGAAVVIDRLVGMATLLGLTLAALPATGLVARLGEVSAREAVAVVAAGAVLGLALAWVRRRTPRGALEAALGKSARLRRLFPAAGLSAVSQAAVATAVWLPVGALGIPVSFPQVLFAVSSAVFFQAIPVTLLGVGATEVAGVAIYLALGLERGDALLLVSLAYLHRLTAAVIGGIWEAAQGGLGLRAPEPARPRGGEEPPAGS